MDWIKRNLFFLIGGLVAVVLLGGAGFYLYKNFSDRAVNKQKLDESYGRLEQLTGMNPGPGDGKKVDNIITAKVYQTNLLNFIRRADKYFEPIAPMPDSTNVTAAEFAAELRITIGHMLRSATNASVQLPPDCNFSFTAIKRLITFAPGSLQPLAVQLGEIKAITDVLFKAKINSLDSLRRERVSPDDTDQADYIELQSITNEIAVLTPYEISFRCFSTELAAVMAGFANSSHCFIVKSVTINSGEATGTGTPGTPGNVPPAAPQPRINQANPYGNNPYGNRPTPPPGGRRMGGDEDVYFYSPSEIVLDEQPLRATILLELVKPINSAN